MGDFKQTQFLLLNQTATFSNVWQKNTENMKGNSACVTTATIPFRSFKSEWDCI